MEKDKNQQVEWMVKNEDFIDDFVDELQRVWEILARENEMEDNKEIVDVRTACEVWYDSFSSLPGKIEEKSIS